VRRERCHRRAARAQKQHIAEPDELVGTRSGTIPNRTEAVRLARRRGPTGSRAITDEEASNHHCRPGGEGEGKLQTPGARNEAVAGGGRGGGARPALDLPGLDDDCAWMMIELDPLTAWAAVRQREDCDGRADDRPPPQGSPSGVDPNPRACHAGALHPTAQDAAAAHSAAAERFSPISRVVRVPLQRIAKSYEINSARELEKLWSVLLRHEPKRNALTHRDTAKTRKAEILLIVQPNRGPLWGGSSRTL
jgi:hypothetical protein